MIQALPARRHFAPNLREERSPIGGRASTARRDSAHLCRRASSSSARRHPARRRPRGSSSGRGRRSRGRRQAASSARSGPSASPVTGAAVSAALSITSATALTVVVVAEVHHAHALRGAALLRDALHAGALDHAVLRDEDEVLVLAHDQRAGEAALLLGQRRSS